MAIPRLNSIRSQLSHSETYEDPDEKLKRLLEEEKAKQPPAPEPVEEKVIEPEPEIDRYLVKYLDLNHTEGRIYFHVWTDEKYVCATLEDMELNPLEDYMIMSLRFPFASKGQYFPTATSFVDAAFEGLTFVEKEELLRDLDLD